MEDENHTGKNTSDLLESKRHAKIRSKYEGINNPRKNRSTINRKYSERYKKNDISNNKIHFFSNIICKQNVLFIIFSIFYYNF